ncbi:MAG: DUF1080 domain-containing protein [Gammaproteobacteria bacterium]|nr:DUF1080 domain-containing protein [Gammaproteobacteria bacterium]
MWQRYLFVLASLIPAFVVAEEGWIELFNGQNLEGWIPKIRGEEPGQDKSQTFRVMDGRIAVAYDGYEQFGDRFGHLFFKRPYSDYRLQLEYRFVGGQTPGAPDWAFRNSGLMVHSQVPSTMPAAQDFPISIEVQFLGGRGDGKERPTANMCSPGTHIVYQGAFTDTHCIPSSAPTFHGDEWVQIEVRVEEDRLVEHRVNGQLVMTYGGLTTGGGVVSGHRPGMKPEGAPLKSGYISLQSEGHPIEFRNIRILDLSKPKD